MAQTRATKKVKRLSIVEQRKQASNQGIQAGQGAHVDGKGRPLSAGWLSLTEPNRDGAAAANAT